MKQLFALFVLMAFLLLFAFKNSPAQATSPAVDTNITDIDSLQIEQQVGGWTMAFAQDNDTLFVSIGTRIHSYDTQTVTDPFWLGQSEPLPDITTDMVLSGRYLYGIVGGNLAVLDVYTPTAPALITYQQTSYRAESIVIQDNFAYVPHTGLWDNDEQKYEGSGLYVFDLSDPVQPTEVAYLNIELGSRFSIALAGDLAYLTANYGDMARLIIINISEPTAPEWINDIYNGQRTDERVGLTIAGDYLYAGVRDSMDGMIIYSLADSPTAPVVQSTHTGPFFMRNLVVTDGLAYVAGSSGGLRLIDVSDPEAPADTGFYKPGVGEMARDVIVSDNIVYVAYGQMGIHVVDVSDHDEITPLMVVNELSYPLSLAIDADYLYVGSHSTGQNGLYIVDPDTLTPLAQYGTNRGFNHLTRGGDYLYATSFPPTQFSIIDVEDIDNIHEAGSLLLPYSIQSYVLAGHYIYIAAHLSGLQVLDVLTPTAPINVGSIDGIGSVLDVAVSGSYVYLANGSNGLRVLDVSDPSAPETVALLDLNFASYLALYEDTLYISESDKLHIINHSDPSNPFLVDTMTLPHDAQEVFLRNNKLYLSTLSGLYIYDLTNQEMPQLIAQAEVVVNSASQLVEKDEKLYVARHQAGLFIFGDGNSVPDPDPEPETAVIFLPLIITE